MSKPQIFIPTCMLIGLTSYFLSRHLFLMLLVLVALWGIAQLKDRYSEIAIVKESNTYRQLLQLAKGDVDLVERLVRYEQKQYPNESRAECIERALARWMRDRR